MRTVRRNRRLLAGLVFFAFATPLPAQPAPPRSGKVCQVLPDTNCTTWVEVGPTTGEAAGIHILEPARNSSSKIIRVIVRFAAAPASQTGSMEITLDSRPFASIPYQRCIDRLCIAERPVTDNEIGMLERANAIQVQSAGATHTIPGRSLAEARAAQGITVAEAQQADNRAVEALKKSAAELNKKGQLPAKPERDPNKENCGSDDIAACDRAINSGNYKGRELADLYHSRGLAYGVNGQKERGTADFNAAIRVDPTFAPAYAERGGDYLHARQFDLAIRDFNEALRLGGEDTSVLFSRGLAYRSKGDRTRAIADFRRVYKLNPRIDTAREVLREMGVEP